MIVNMSGSNLQSIDQNHRAIAANIIAWSAHNFLQKWPVRPYKTMDLSPFRFIATG